MLWKAWKVRHKVFGGNLIGEQGLRRRTEVRSIKLGLMNTNAILLEDTMFLHVSFS